MALSKPTQQAASLDLSGMATILLDSGLAKLDGRVVAGRELARLDRVADPTTLKGIARLLLAYRPPSWLRSVVIEGKLVQEFIPKNDLEAIAWLGDDLEPIIVAVHNKLYGASDEHFRKALGDAGELAIMSAYRGRGDRPRHVSLVSDRFGYDIELGTLAQMHGVEVKSAVAATAGRIMLSRNEYEVAQRMGSRWKVAQVIFSSKVVATRSATKADVEAIRELSSEALSSLAPSEDKGFRWIEAAEFRPSPHVWTASSLVVGSDFHASLE